jgi:ribosomal protein S20
MRTRFLLLVLTLVITGWMTFFSGLAQAASPTMTPAATPAAKAQTSPSPSPTTQPAASAQPTPEAKSQGAAQVQPGVESDMQKQAEEKRKQLLNDAQAALEDTRKALDALEHNNKDEALAALERVTGKLDLIVAREPALALAPVEVNTIVRDLYSQPDTVRKALKQVKSDLDNGRVQQARALLSGLASEWDTQVLNIPLATYPVAIRQVAPLIDQGKIDEAKTALRLVLGTLVVQDHITPLPKLRAQMMLEEADKLTEKTGRSEEENKKLHDLLEDARHELQLGELLGYGTPGDYKPLYVQLDELQKKTEGGKSGKGFFDRIKESLRNLKDKLSD